jgi:hypothetical protein
MAQGNFSKKYKQEDIAHLLHGFIDQREFIESGKHYLFHGVYLINKSF